MNRKLYLECIKDRWYAVQHYEAYEGTQAVVKKRYKSLQIVGKDKKRAAERALRALEITLVQEQRENTPTSDMSVQEYASHFLAAAAIDVRPATLRSYELWVKRFALSYGHIPLAQITAQTIETWKIDLSASLSPSSINVALRSVRTMFSKAVKQGLLPKTPFAAVSMADVPKRTFPPFWTPEQYERFIATVETPRQRAGFALAFYAGLRSREVVTLRWEDVREDHIVIMNREDARTKGDRARKVPLYSSLRAALTEIPHIGSYVMASKYQEVSDDRILSQKFLKYRRRLPTLPAITFHGLRHSFATNLAMQGIPIAVLQKLLGHQDIQTTMLYTHVQEDHVLDLARKIDL